VLHKWPQVQLLFKNYKKKIFLKQVCKNQSLQIFCTVIAVICKNLFFNFVRTGWHTESCYNFDKENSKFYNKVSKGEIEYEQQIRDKFCLLFFSKNFSRRIKNLWSQIKKPWILFSLHTRAGVKGGQNIHTRHFWRFFILICTHHILSYLFFSEYKRWDSICSSNFTRKKIERTQVRPRTSSTTAIFCAKRHNFFLGVFFLSSVVYTKMFFSHSD
jgi:hypothetical protein